MDFEKFDINGSNEVFGSSILQELLKEVKDAKWIDVSKIKTPKERLGSLSYTKILECHKMNNTSENGTC